MAALSIEQVLAEEAEAIQGTKGLADALLKDLVAALDANAKDVQFARYRMDADERSGKNIPGTEVQARKAFYRALNGLNRAALCCSGGGMRSATFCLGVFQALAAHNVGGEATVPANNATLPDTTKPAIKGKASLLGCFQFLSTVSGGSYIGSWLSSWLKRNEFHEVIESLTGRPYGPDIEPPEISWLRAYSNYLTPRFDIASADTWAAVTIFVRNLIINWLIIVPAFCLVLLSLKLTATVSVWIAHSQSDRRIMIPIAVIGAICLIFAQAFANSHRPTRRTQRANVSERSFLLGDLTWAVASAIYLAVFFSSHYFYSGFAGWTTSIMGWLGLTDVLQYLGLDFNLKSLLLTAIAGFLVYAAGWIAGWRFRKGGLDFLAWAASGLVYGALVGLGAYLFSVLGPYPATPDKIKILLLSLIFGVPWILMSQLAAENIFVGLMNYGAESDADREWLGRAAGWLAAGAIAWGLIAFLVFAGEYAVRVAEVISVKALVAAVAFAGAATALLGMSSRNYVISFKELVAVGGIVGIAAALVGAISRAPATATSADQGNKTATSNIVLAVAGPIFVAALIVGLSIALDQLLLGTSLVRQLQMPMLTTRATLARFAVGWVIIAVVGLLASYFVNVNRLSLHALNRNRLIRGYLGASRQTRDPDRFTGFDIKDDISVYKIWPPKSDHGPGAHSLFHVVNIALNVVSTKRLAWQERRAESFTVTPRHCGSAYLGFRPSDEYGDRPGRGGITLGTAMAISGAAASPNMGYNSSPSIALVLSLLNIRLGWWLGNPGEYGEESYQSDGPKWAAKPLFYEAFGQTTYESRYVYLSDGGHFENLGLYEMVRRRCRFIVAIDAGCDPDLAFADLGNAVRKIYIDLGIRIRFVGLEALRNHPSALDGDPTKIPYFAIGTIDYKEADGGGNNGYVLYIKPAYHGTEGAGIRSYATANQKFPHEATADQWFTESQFEGYRSLGLEIANDILGRDIVLCAEPRLSLRDALRALKVQAPP
jgi:hypothetical protein